MKKMMREGVVPVLILSAHTIALGMARALGPKGVSIYLASYDDKDMAQKSKYVSDCFPLAHPEQHAADFIDGLLDIGRNIGRAVLFAADDPTLTTVTKHAAKLREAFIVPTPDWSVMQKVINKDLTYAVAQQEGVPFPRTTRLDISSPLSQSLVDEFSFPCLIKPVQSHSYYEIFKTKMRVVNDMQQLLEGFDLCRKHRIDVTVQEIIPGDDTHGYNFNSLFYGGKVQQGFAAGKVRMTDHGYGIPSVVRSRSMIDALWSSSEKLLNAIGYEGYSCIEYKYDERDGLYKLLDVNGRYNRSSLLSVKVGINFPWIEYNHLVHGIHVVPQDWHEGVYYIDMFKDIQENIGHVLHGRLSLFSFLRPYFSKHVFAVFSFRDPAPFIKHAGDGLMLPQRKHHRCATVKYNRVEG
ncbi:MAG: hypothetical protein EOL87_05235 [Spartobacteria bacterium]|nr:hypothetical protein [Spartobacteria bacterium]